MRSNLLKNGFTQWLRTKSKNFLSSASAFAISACGAGKKNSDNEDLGFPDTYVPPKADFSDPIDMDPNFERFKPRYEDPYWVQALTMDKDQEHVSVILEQTDHVLAFTFPEIKPDYEHFAIRGWQVATDDMIVATREILESVENILNVTFEEVDSAYSTNVIAIGRSLQTNSAGLSYFPNVNYQIGMDVFIASDYAKPKFVNSILTNYDYEVLLHELGHALGLKHPFEASGANKVILSSKEDQTLFTAMSYEATSTTFDGQFRVLDLMALTALYGVNAEHNNGNDTYMFSGSVGKGIIDGSGLDTIDASATSQNVFIDLRQGSQSYLGLKSQFITEPYQLSISNGTIIENAKTGMGDDTVIGNDHANFITTFGGSDTIFAGGGEDIVNPGLGFDVIDLSEYIQSKDIIEIYGSHGSNGIDTVYGFIQGVLGDIVSIKDFKSPAIELFPLVSVQNVPYATFDSGVLRIFGEDLSTSSALEIAFKDGGKLANLNLSNGSQSLIITAGTQETGDDQSLFIAESMANEIDIVQLMLFTGNSLDIDNWHLDNFNVVDFA